MNKYTNFFLIVSIFFFTSCNKKIIEYQYFSDSKLAPSGEIFEDANQIIVRDNQIVIINERGAVNFAIDVIRQSADAHGNEVTKYEMHTYDKHPRRIKDNYLMKILELPDQNEVWIYVANSKREQIMNINRQMVVKVKRPRKELID